MYDFKLTGLILKKYVGIFCNILSFLTMHGECKGKYYSVIKNKGLIYNLYRIQEIWWIGIFFMLNI